jgi:hypothetical protein
MDKPISTAVQTALDNVLGNATVLATKPALDTLSELAEAVSDICGNMVTKTYVDHALNDKAPSANPVFTGSIKIPAMSGVLKSFATGIAGGLVQTTDIAVGAINKSMVGLGNVDNTSDSNKPVSAAMQTALNDKAPVASPTFTGTVTLPTPTDASSNQASTTEFVMRQLYDVSNNKFTIVNATISNIIPTVGAMVFSLFDQKLYVCAQDASGVVSWFDVGASKVVEVVE